MKEFMIIWNSLNDEEKNQTAQFLGGFRKGSMLTELINALSKSEN